jgi:hypothetical protein
MAEIMKMIVFWHVAPYSLVEIYRRFRSAYCLQPVDSHLLVFRPYIQVMCLLLLRQIMFRPLTRAGRLVPRPPGLIDAFYISYILMHSFSEYVNL